MGRSPCCSKQGLNRGAWTALEDKILKAYIKAHGEGKWRNLPKRAGLKRCGKSCRLRWLNYLRPDIKRGNISHDEEELILRLHKLLGNRWSLIAGRLPGRTDNEIKNYWNTTLGKKARAESSPRQSKQSPIDKYSRMKKLGIEPSGTPQAAASQPQVIRTKATKCTKVLLPALPPPNEIQAINSTAIDPLELQALQSYMTNHSQDLDNLTIGYGIDEDLQETYAHDMNFPNFDRDEFRAGHDNAKENYDHNNSLCMGPDQSLGFSEPMFEPMFDESWTATNCLEDNATLDLESLTFLLDSEEWP